jgi:uncharacterized RDD family membrane protein YckC
VTTVDPPAAPAGAQVATPARRINGFLVDQVISVVSIVAVALAAGFEPQGRISEQAVWNLGVAVLSVSFVYHALMVGFLGRRVGKLAAGTMVISAIDGGRLAWTGATLRALVPQAAGVVPGIGFALTIGVYGTVVFDPLRRGLHDRAAGSLVVRHRPAG